MSSSEATRVNSGGKGANLARMVRSGFPVPPGFLITTTAYEAFIAANRVDARIAEVGRSLRSPSPEALEAASQNIRDLFVHGLIPEDVVREIVSAYEQLSPDASPVAVRSSATSEDHPDASFAGQHATYLNVRGAEALLEAVKRCWASLWTARALAYRVRQIRSEDSSRPVIQAAGGDPVHGSPSLAVVVQQMVPADSAGVLFTMNPVNGDRDESLINAAWGLGETVVSGRVTPDTLILHKSTDRVKSVEVGDKVVMSVYSAEGTTEVSVESHQRRQPVLNEQQAAELVRLGRTIEAHFGTPQDIEWAIAGESVFILQSRAVTRLPRDRVLLSAAAAVPGDDDWPAVGERPAQPTDLWTRAVLGEIWPHPVSPLMWSGVSVFIGNSIRYGLRGLRISGLEETQWAGRFYGRVYYNEGALAQILSHELGLPGSFVNRALGSRCGADPGREGSFRLLRFLQRVPGFLRVALSQLGTGRELETLFTEIDQWTADFKIRSLEQRSDRELWAELMAWAERFQQAISLQSKISSIGITAFALLELLMGRWCGRKDLARDLMSGLSGVYAAEMGPALWQICQMLRGLGLASLVLDDEPKAALSRLQEMPAARPVIQLLESFLERFGHRCPNEGEWLNPRWVDAPEQVVEAMAGYLQAGDRFNPTEGEARQRQRREDALAWTEAHLDPLRRSIFRLCLARAQHGARLRENGKHYYMKLALVVRRIEVLYGERWSSRGWLKKPADIFFLTLPDLKRVVEAGDPVAAGLDLRTLVDERHKSFQYWSDVAAPEVIGADGRPVATQPDAEPEGPVMLGIAASGGQVRGRARIIHSPREANRLQTGDILVTRAIDPGWSLVFPLAAGLVLEMGGVLSHAAIIAREYGLPAVVNVKDAIRRIRDGQTITVNGTTGHIYLDGADT